MNNAVRKYILPIFDPSTAIASITSSKDKAIEMEQQLQAIGFDVQLVDISGADDDASSTDGEVSSGSDSEDEGSDQEQSGSSSESWQMEDGDVKMQ